MQSVEQSGSSTIGLPELGPNKLQQAIRDYDLMVDQLANASRQLKEMSDLSSKLLAENDALRSQIKTQAEFLTRQVDIITAHRDRLQTSLKGLMTRYRVIRECFSKCEEEALAEGIDLTETTKTSSEEVKRLIPRRLPMPGIDWTAS